MAVFTPSTIVYLVDSPVNDYKNQLDFASAAAQAQFFISKLKHSYTDFTYQRKENFIRIPANIETLYDSNYVMYQNANFGTKWFYCFITKFEYVNPTTTNVYIETDVFQTWQFDFSFLRSFVAREHVADDTVWLHTLPEPISKPEYYYSQLYSKIYNSTPGNSGTSWIYAVFATPDSGNDEVRPAIDNGSYTEVTNYTIGHMRTSGYLFGSPDYDKFKILIEFLIAKNYDISYTICLPAGFVIGYLAVKWNGIFDTTVYDFKIYGDVIGNETEYINLVSLTTTVINNHSVKNNKLNCYPFRFCEITDDNNQKIDLKYELMNVTHDSQHNWQGAFNITKTAGSTPAAMLYPPYYAGKSSGLYSKSITLSSFPPVPYSVDYFKQYLALHKSSFVTENIRQAIDLGVGVGYGSTANGGINAASSIMDYFSYMAKYSDLANRPPETHNSPTGEPNFVANALKFKIYDVTPTTEYLDKIDSFFDRYGYNVSITKIPQYNSRVNWNYLETKEVEIQGEIPKEDIDKLKNMFNSGCTIWHNPLTFGDYSLRNNIA